MKDKLFFILKCILVLVPFFVVSIYCKNNMIGFTDEEAPYYIWNKNICNTTQDKVYSSIFIGDSVANAAYIPEVLSDNSINLSLGGTSPIENYYIIKDYLEHNPCPKNIFISFTDLHLEKADCFWRRIMYSHRFNPTQNWEIIKTAVQYDDKLIATDNYLLDYISYELYLPNKYITTLANASFNQRYESNSLALNNSITHGGRYIGLGTNEGDIPAIVYTDFFVSPLLDFYYRKTIELCIEAGANVHIIKLPLPNVSSFTDSYKEQFNTYYDNLKLTYPSISIDWFSDGYDVIYFTDKHHMNTRGSYKFCLELKKMYPGAFDNNYTENQLTTILKDMEEETKIYELLNWARLGPYSLVIYDNNNFISTLSQNQLLENDLTVNIIDSNIAVVRSRNAQTIDIVKFGNNYTILPPNKDSDAPEYNWSPSTQNTNILIFNNIYNSVDSERIFNYMDTPYFQLVQ